MRLAYILGTYPQPSETFIAREVAGLRARGHEVHLFSVFAPQSGPVAGINYGWPTAPGRFFRRYCPGCALHLLTRRWRHLITSLRCDAVVAHFGSLPSTVALAAAGDLPLIISLHARDLYVEAERLADKLARACAVITCTQANVDHLRAQFPRYAEKIHLIYHGLPDAWLQLPIPERSRAPGEPLRILAAGRLVEKKGFEFLLDACAHLKANNVPLRISLVGDGPLCEILSRQAERLGLRDVLAMEGWMDEVGLRAAFAWADLFCCPSVIAADGDRDGLPNVVVEAMSGGLPIIGSRLSGIPEVVEDDVTGLLVPPADPAALAVAITRCADPALRARLGRQAHNFVGEHFAAGPWLDRLETIFARV